MKNNIKRSLILCLIMVFVLQMVVVISPAGFSAYAEETRATQLTNSDAYTVFVGSDRHGSGDSLVSVVTTAENYVETNHATSISKTVFVGDLVDSGDVTSSYSSASGLAAVNGEFRYVLSWFSEDGSDNFYTYGDSHDKSVTSSGVINHFLDSAGKSGSTTPTRDTGAKELGEWAYLWGIDHFEMKEASKATTAAAEFTSWVNSLPDNDHRVIIIASHVPLHSRRGDNAGAVTWLSAINAAAEDNDIIFIWGHNHTGWNNADQDASFVTPGNSITPQGGQSTDINFTYALAGYIGKSATNAWRGSTITIEDEKIVVDHYSLTAHSDAKEIQRHDLNSGTNASLRANDITTSLDAYGNVEDATIQYTFKVNGNDSSDVTFEVKSDQEGIIQSISETGIISFAGKAGTATVTITGTYQDEDETKTVSKDITVTVKAYVSGLNYGYSSTSEEGSAYVIVSNGYALVNDNGNVGYVKAEVDGDRVLIAGNDLSSEGYDETKLLWTVGSDGSLKNGNYYVRRASGNSAIALTLNTSTANKYTNWTYTGEQLTVKGGQNSNTTYYIYHDGSGWKTGTSTNYTAKLYKKIPPSFKTQSLVLSGQIGVNFNMDLPEIEGVNYADSYMTFDITGKGTVEERQDFDPTRTNRSGTLYTFTCYVNSIQMADTISATFHYTEDGKEKTIEKTYSVKEYIEEFDAALEANSSAFDAETINLVHALADYGHYVQPFLSNARSWTIGTDYAEMDKYYAGEYNYTTIKGAVSAKAIDRQIEGNDIEKITYSLTLDSETAINVYFQMAAGYNGSFSAKLDGDTYTASKQSDGRYLIKIKGISAHLLDDVHNIAVTTDGGGATVKVAALSYVYGLLDMADASDEYKLAAAAIYSYSQAAEAYVAQ